MKLHEFPSQRTYSSVSWFIVTTFFLVFFPLFFFVSCFLYVFFVCLFVCISLLSRAQVIELVWYKDAPSAKTRVLRRTYRSYQLAVCVGGRPT